MVRARSVAFYHSRDPFENRKNVSEHPFMESSPYTFPARYIKWPFAKLAKLRSILVSIPAK